MNEGSSFQVQAACCILPAPHKIYFLVAAYVYAITDSTYNSQWHMKAAPDYSSVTHQVHHVHIENIQAEYYTRWVQSCNSENNADAATFLLRPNTSACDTPD